MAIPFHERFTCTVPNALDVLGIGRTKLYELIKRGDVEVTKIDGRTLVIVQSLQKLARGSK